MYYHLTKNQINDGIRICYDRIQLLLNHCEIIFSKIPNSNIGIGMFTIAIEELGKLLLLQDVFNTTPNSDCTFNVNTEIFGIGVKRSHTKMKFNRVLSVLPDLCKKIGNVVGAHYEPSFSPIFNYDVTDFQLRKEVFYVDWDDVNKKWKTDVNRDGSHPQNAINELKKWISQNIHV